VIAAGFDHFEEPEETRRAGRGSAPKSFSGPQTSTRGGQPAHGLVAPSRSEGLRSDPPLRGESRGDLPEVFPSRDDLSEERDVFADADDDIDLDDDFDVPSFLK
jgi:hypothetical protein